MEEEAKQKKTSKKKPKKERKLEKQIILMFIVLALILASFLIAHSFLKPKPYFEFAGFTVYKARIEGINEIFYVIPLSGGGGKGEVMLRNDPRELNIPIEVDKLFSGISKVWITTPPGLSSDAVLAANDLGILTKTISLDTGYALTEAPEGNYPEITCENATKETRVFLINLGDETKVYEDGYCIIVQGKNYDELIKASDALVIHWLSRIKI